MYIYSGKCRLGKVGEPTNLTTTSESPLCVGDIVITSTIDEFGICSNNGLTAVVSDKYTTFQTGKDEHRHDEKQGETEYFIMGIKGVDYMDKDYDKWHVALVKSHKEVIPGEHWDGFGFNYKED
jgi:hypothetical protein